MIAGREISVEEVMAIVRQDASFYEFSGGGVTLSGGEPLLQREFSAALLRNCKTECYDTAVETGGNVSWKALAGVLPYVDLWLYDFKLASPRLHRKYCGASNGQILRNLCRLSESSAVIEVHMPIIPSINDSRELIEVAARFLASLDRVERIRLIPYHRLAGSKYESLGRPNSMPLVESPSRKRLNEIARWIREYGLRVIIPSIGVDAQRPYTGDRSSNGKTGVGASREALARSVDKLVDRDEID